MKIPNYLSGGRKMKVPDYTLSALESIRETMLLFGESGMWESFNKELADARARKKRQLEELSKIRKRNELIIACIIGAVFFGIGSYFAIYYFLQTVG